MPGQFLELWNQWDAGFHSIENLAIDMGLSIMSSPSAALIKALDDVYYSFSPDVTVGFLLRKGDTLKLTEAHQVNQLLLMTYGGMGVQIQLWK